MSTMKPLDYILHGATGPRTVQCPNCERMKAVVQQAATVRIQDEYGSRAAVHGELVKLYAALDALETKP